jgi:hypothetical protein
MVPGVSLWRQTKIKVLYCDPRSCGISVFQMVTSQAAPYADAIPALEKSGGAATVEAFLKFYGLTEMPRAFAV